MSKQEMCANPIATPLSGGGGGANNPLVAMVSGLFSKFACTGYGFAKKGTKILRHWGTRVNGHSEGGTATLHVTNFRNNLSRHCEERSDEAISLKLQASVQRNVAIASNRDLRKQNTECAVRRSNDVVGAVPIRSNVCFSFFGSFSFFLHHDKKKEMNNKKRDCFATLAMTCEKCRKSLSLKWLCHLAMTCKRSLAFTLSEVLIVLAVLGVVAAMTIPDLIQDYREKSLITALKRDYTVFSQAVDMATVENGPITDWDMGESAGTSESALKLYNILKPYLKVEKTCGVSKGEGCFADDYEALFNPNIAWQPDKSSSYAKGVLASGASFLIWSGGPGHYGYVGIDVNGKSGPNKAGVDYFWICIWRNGLKPAGESEDPSSFQCLYNDTRKSNGLGCTWWVLKHENMDYLRKAGCYYRYCN